MRNGEFKIVFNQLKEDLNKMNTIDEKQSRMVTFENINKDSLTALQKQKIADLRSTILEENIEEVNSSENTNNTPDVGSNNKREENSLMETENLKNIRAELNRFTRDADKITYINQLIQSGRYDNIEADINSTLTPEDIATLRQMENELQTENVRNIRAELSGFARDEDKINYLNNIIASGKYDDIEADINSTLTAEEIATLTQMRDKMVNERENANTNDFQPPAVVNERENANTNDFQPPAVVNERENANANDFQPPAVVNERENANANDFQPPVMVNDNIRDEDGNLTYSPSVIPEKEEQTNTWSQGWEDEEREEGTVSAHYGPEQEENNNNGSWSQGWEDEEREEGTVSAHYGPEQEENNNNDSWSQGWEDEEREEGTVTAHYGPQELNENEDINKSNIQEVDESLNDSLVEETQEQSDQETDRNIEISQEEKTFEEILAQIEAAKNAVSDAQYRRYQSATGKWLVPVQKDKGDWLRNFARGVVGGIGSVINIPRKLINMIRTTPSIREKISNAQENVDNLSPEDFRILREGLQGYKGHENKVSISVWEAVKNRENREMKDRNEKNAGVILANLEAVREDHARSLEIENELNTNTSLTPEERTALQAEKEVIDRDNTELIRLIEEKRQTGAMEQGGAGLHGLEEEGKARSEGSNMSGRKFARRYSTNEELEAKQAELKKAQREARRDGDNFTEVASFLAHEDLLNENTFDQNFLGIRISRSDRHHEDAIFSKSYQEDDLLRNTLIIATTVASLVNIYRQVQNQRIVDEANQQINNSNAQNQEIAGRAEKMRQDILSQQETINRGVDATEQAKVGATWAAGHEHAGAASNYTNNWGSTQLDETFHKVINGQLNDQTMGEMMRNAESVIKQYAAQHPKYDYTALVNSVNNLGNGGLEAISTYNNAMKTLVANAMQSGQFTAQQVNNFAINPTYLETMIPLVVAGYAATSKEYQLAERRAERKMKREQLENEKDEEQKENAQPENVQPEDIKSENIEPENVQPEDIKSENIEPENVQPEDIKSENVDTENIEQNEDER